MNPYEVAMMKFEMHWSEKNYKLITAIAVVKLS